MKFKELKIDNLIAKIPLIQGGMGIGVSLSGLASAVANEGAIGVISGVQIGFREKSFSKDPLKSNLSALNKEIFLAREKSPKGIIAVNLMAAMNNYEVYADECVKSNIDIIISGAGLPLTLPNVVKNSKVKIIPIVSSLKAARIIITSWLKHDRLPDAIIVEGSMAGGHLGFKYPELEENRTQPLEEIIKEVKEFVKSYEINYKTNIPIIGAGGISTHADVNRIMDSGADGIQVSTPFVATEECDAHINFKKAYIDANAEDAILIKSPVGMPARAIKNNFMQNILDGKKEDIINCYRCMKSCDINNIPFCISKALINSVTGHDGLVFCGANVGQIKEISTVKQVIGNLFHI